MATTKNTQSDYFHPEFVPWNQGIPNRSAPVGQWGEDLLGPGFVAQSIALPDDEEGAQVATLVRHLPEVDPDAIPIPEKADKSAKPCFSFLYIHGWNDYYFQRELARHVAVAGGAFYALDLRKYGRSLRLWQTNGWVDDLATYDEEIAAAKQIIETEYPGLPFVLSGHSTGGLVASYWAKRHPLELAGLVLNSPWIEMPNGISQRKMVARLAALGIYRDPKGVFPFQDGDSVYADAIGQGWTETDGIYPPEWEEWRSDPSVQGWPIQPLWKGGGEFYLRFGWGLAITRAQQENLELRPLDIPVFMATAKESNLNLGKPEVHHSDTVLNVETMGANAWRISTQLTYYRFDGMHDLLLSYPPVRQQFWRAFHGWVSTNFAGCVKIPLSQWQIAAICP